MKLRSFLAGSALMVGLCMAASTGAQADPILGFNITNIDVTNLSGSTFNPATNFIEVVQYQNATSGQINADVGNGLAGLNASSGSGAGLFLTNYSPFNSTTGSTPFFNNPIPVQGSTNPDNNFALQGAGSSTAGTGNSAGNIPAAPGLDTANNFTYVFWLVSENSTDSAATSADFLGTSGLGLVSYSLNTTEDESFLLNAGGGNTVDLAFAVTPLGLPEPPASLTLGLLLGAAFVLRKSQLV